MSLWFWSTHCQNYLSPGWTLYGRVQHQYTFAQLSFVVWPSSSVQNRLKKRKTETEKNQMNTNRHKRNWSLYYVITNFVMELASDSSLPHAAKQFQRQNMWINVNVIIFVSFARTFCLIYEIHMIELALHLLSSIAAILFAS